MSNYGAGYKDGAEAVRTLQQKTISDLMDERWKARAEAVTVVTDVLGALEELTGVEYRHGSTEKREKEYEAAQIQARTATDKAKAFLDKTIPSPVAEGGE